MSMELGVGGPRVDLALDALLNSARFNELLSMIDNAPDQLYAGAVWEYLDSKDVLWAALSEAKIDFHVLERIVMRKGFSAVDPILDVAEKTRDTRLREKFLELLLKLGDEIGPPIVRRI